MEVGLFRLVGGGFIVLAMLPEDMQCIGSAAGVATSMAKRIRCRRGVGDTCGDAKASISVIGGAREKWLRRSGQIGRGRYFYLEGW